MSAVRTSLLSPEEIARFHRDGYISPLKVLTAEQVTMIRDAVEEHLAGRFRSERYELTDPIEIRRVVKPDGEERFEYETIDTPAMGAMAMQPTVAEEKPFPFLFNLWKIDRRFWEIGSTPALAGMARQLLGCAEVLLMEDNVVVKRGKSKRVPWHQDFSYWPLAKPNAITVWIALDHVSHVNGAMQVVPGSHGWREHLPVHFGTEQPFMQEFRPGLVAGPQDPESLGHEIVTYDLQPGECGFHHAMLWHGSSPNQTTSPRLALVFRYLASGTVWLGAARMPYDDIGCAVGAPVTAAHFPVISTAI